MSDKSEIQWTDATWNPTTGCTRVSPGCAHCYIERTPPFRIHHRRFDRKGHIPLELHWERLEQPLHWTKPRSIFVNSLSDLFHVDVPDELISRVFATMALAHWHRFQVLTKRDERMHALITSDDFRASVNVDIAVMLEDLPEEGAPRRLRWDPLERRTDDARATAPDVEDDAHWPLPNVHLGVSTENQRFLRQRLTTLLRTPAAVRFISAEPLLGPLDLSPWIAGNPDCPKGDPDCTSNDGECHDACERPGLHWVIVGGESGKGARTFDITWARQIVHQCQDAGIPVFMKQLGSRPIRSRVDLATYTPAAIECEHGHDVCPACDAGTFPLELRDSKGGDPKEWPSGLNVREMPR